MLRIRPGATLPLAQGINQLSVPARNRRISRRREKRRKWHKPARSEDVDPAGAVWDPGAPDVIEATTHTTTLERVRSVRRRLQVHIAQEISELRVDPLAEQAASMSGVEYLQRWVPSPDVAPPPPIALLFCMEWVELEPSRAVVSLEPAEWMFNALGVIHGGVAATLLDTVLGAAVHSTLPAGTGFAT